MRARIYRTKYEAGEIKTWQEDKEFTKDTGSQELQIINIYPEVKGQKIRGFGGAITEAVGHILKKMPDSQVDEVLTEYFSKNGMNYRMVRTHLDSCDFSLGNYSAAETEMDIRDCRLSYAHDEAFIVPYIKRAAEVRGEDIPVMLTPWSPPAFMKTNGQRNGGGQLMKEYYPMWAAYVAAYIKQYREWGLNVDKLSVQNEPNATQTWDSCIFSGKEEREFLAEHLYPALVKNGLDDVGVYIWDHNKERIFDRARETIDSITDEMIEGIAFHWYSGDHFEGVRLVRQQFPEKELLFSEGCIEYSKFDGDNQLHNAEMYAHDMIGNFNNGMNTFIDWNIVLDEEGGPNHAGNYCEAPVIYDTAAQKWHKKLSFYYIGHFSRYINAGADKIATTRFSEDIEVLAAQNPDGGITAVVLNRQEREQEIFIRMDGNLMKLNMPDKSIATVVIHS